jgi:FkbM family methyltransferase
MPTEQREYFYRKVPFNVLVNTEPDNDSSSFTFIDEQIVRDTLFQVRPGDLVFDVGCGFGSYSFSALAIGALHAHAWSVNTPHVEMMHKSIALNPGWDSKITVNGTGLYKESGWLCEATQAFSKTWFEGSFPVATLDDYVSKLPWAGQLIDNGSASTPFLAARGKTWLKIDTEGAELNILLGAKQFLLDYRPNILLENHENLVPGITQAVQEWLSIPQANGGPGYRVSKWVPHHHVSHSVYLPEECIPS